MLSWIAGPLRLASILACLVVMASFGLFVIHEAGNASTHQVEEITGTPVAGRSGSASTHPANAAHKTVRSRIEEVAKKITSPFSAVTDGSSSQWTIRGVGLLLTLAIYGFGVGFLARVLRMR